MSDGVEVISVERPSAEELKEAIKIANEDGQGSASDEEQKQALFKLGAEIASLIEEGLTKEAVHDRLVALGLKADLVDGVYALGLKMHANHDGALKHHLRDLVINGTEQEKDYVMLLVMLANNLKAEGKSKPTILAELQLSGDIGESTANAIFELSDEVQDAMAGGTESGAAGLLVTLAIIVVGALIFYFMSGSGAEDGGGEPAVAEKSPQEMNCTDETVLLSARKLFVLQMNNYSKPMTSTERLMESSMRRANKSSGTDAMLNAMKVQYLNPNSVALRDVKQVSGPGTADLSAKNPAADVRRERPWEEPNRNEMLYLCEATATIALPASAHGRINELSPVVAATLHYKDNVIELPVFYNTELNESEELITGIGFTNPMTDVILSVLLRQEVAAADDE